MDLHRNQGCHNPSIGHSLSGTRFGFAPLGSRRRAALLEGTVEGDSVEGELEIDSARIRSVVASTLSVMKDDAVFMAPEGFDEGLLSVHDNESLYRLVMDNWDRVYNKTSQTLEMRK